MRKLSLLILLVLTAASSVIAQTTLRKTYSLSMPISEHFSEGIGVNGIATVSLDATVNSNGQFIAIHNYSVNWNGSAGGGVVDLNDPANSWQGPVTVSVSFKQAWIESHLPSILTWYFTLKINGPNETRYTHRGGNVTFTEFINHSGGPGGPGDPVIIY
jgi:hypothetical protein